MCNALQNQENKEGYGRDPHQEIIMANKTTEKNPLLQSW